MPNQIMAHKMSKAMKNAIAPLGTNFSSMILIVSD